MVTVAGKISRLYVGLNRGSKSGVIDADRMVVVLELEDGVVQEWHPIPAKDAPLKVGEEEQARRALGLAETYLASQKPQKAMGILRSIVSKYPQTKAAEIAKKHLKRLSGSS